jgi:hypothetical protein
MPDLSRRVADSIRQHFVSLSCVQELPDSETRKILVFSGFVVEIADEWFYITAGHILRLIRTALSIGSTFDIWRLGDHTVANKFNGMAVPYDFELDQWCVIEDEDQGLDYAAIHLSSYYRRQLEAGGISPLTMSAWGTPDMNHDHWVLAGIPSESVTYDGITNIAARFVAAPLTATNAPPLAGARSQNQFYALLADGGEEVVRDIDGMSGGPVFMLKHEDGRWKYGVIGVQSGWYPSVRTIAACPFASFAFALEEVIQTAQQQANSNAPPGAA